MKIRCTKDALLLLVGLSLTGCDGPLDIPLSETERHWAYIQRSKGPAVQEQYRELRRLHPEEPLTHIYLSLVDADSAEQHLLKAIDVQPHFHPARIMVGRLYNDRGEPDKALVHLEEAAAIWPEDGGTYYELGRAYELKTEKTKLLHKRALAREAREMYRIARQKAGGREYEADVERAEALLKDVDGAIAMMKRIAHLFTWVYSDGWLSMSMTFYSDGTWSSRTSLDHQQSYGTWSGDAYDLRVYEYGMLTDIGYVDPDDPNALVLNTGVGTVRMRKR